MATKAKAKSATKADTSTITDIPHEPILPESPMETPAVQSVEAEEEPLTTEMVIAREVKRYNIADAAIEQYKKEFKKLKIKGIDDKEGYKKVKEAWQTVRGKRLEVSAKHKDIKEDYLKIARAIDGEKNRLTELLEPLEDELKGKMDAIDEAKEAEKLRKAKEEEDRLNLRVEKLCELGATMQQGYYRLGDTIAMDIATLRSMTDEQYTSLHSAASLKAAEIKADQEKKDKEKKDEQDRMDKQREEQAATQKRLKDQQDELDRQKKQLEEQQRQAAQAIKDARRGRVLALGLNEGKDYFSKSYGKETIQIKADHLYDAEPADFESVLLILKNEMDLFQQNYDKAIADAAKAKEELDKKKTEISTKMADAGFTYNYNREAFTFKNTITDLEITMAVLVTDDMVDDKVADWKNIITLAKKQQEDNEEAERQKAEDFRLAKLGDDGILKEAFKVLCDDTSVWYDNYRPKLTTETAEQNLRNFIQALNNLIALHGK